MLFRSVIIGMKVIVKTDNCEFQMLITTPMLVSLFCSVAYYIFFFYFLPDLSVCTKATSVVLVSPQIQEALHLERWLFIPAFLYSFKTKQPTQSPSNWCLPQLIITTFYLSLYRYRHNCSVLMTSVLEKRYCNPFVLLPPVGDTMLCTISSVATATRFVRDPALPIFFYFFKAFFLLL